MAKRLLIACVSGLMMASVALAATEMQSFDSEAAAAAAGWMGSNNRDAGSGCDYGWSDSANAGGTAGEAGGDFARYGTSNWYADTTIGTLTLDDPMAASGTFRLVDPGSWIGGQVIGWFNKDDFGYSDTIGIRMNDTSAAAYRWEPRIDFTSGQSGLPRPVMTLSTDVHYSWELTYDPAGGDNQSGLVTLQVWDDDDNHALMGTKELHMTADQRANEALTVNAFGISTVAQSNPNPAQFANMFMDDLVYTVPEPTMLALLAFGGLGLLRRRR